MNHTTAAATIVLVTLVFTAANHVNDLTDQQIKQQLGGEAKPGPRTPFAPPGLYGLGVAVPSTVLLLVF